MPCECQQDRGNRDDPDRGSSLLDKIDPRLISREAFEFDAQPQNGQDSDQGTNGAAPYGGQTMREWLEAVGFGSTTMVEDFIDEWYGEYEP